MSGHRNFVYTQLLSLIGLFFVGGCSGTFEPWQQNNQYHFSIYGYLDASADTQWVRVMPVREELFLDPRPVDVTVTLEHLNSGERVVMNDSLFAYAHDRYAWNFWTTKELLPEETYLLNAQKSDGMFSRARVTLPSEFHAPIVLIQNSPRGVPERATIVLEGIDRLADVRTVYGQNRIAHLGDTSRTSSGAIQVVIDIQEVVDVLEPFNSDLSPSSLIGSSSPSGAKIFIASAGPDYHHFGSIVEKVIALPEGVSNIDNGVGYLAGIVSMTLPFESCMAEGMKVVPCEQEPPPW